MRTISTSQAYVEGEYYRVLVATQDSTISATSVIGDDITDLQVYAGTTIYGLFTAVSVSVGEVTAYLAGATDIESVWSYINTYGLNNGAIIEAADCAKDAIEPLLDKYYAQASLVLVPSLYKTSVVYAERPLDANGQLTFTRASNATRVGPDGYIEKVRTNEIRNSSMVGAATPNTLPTNYSSSLSGLTREIVGVGTENGLPYIDYKLSGTASGLISTLQFETNSQIIAAPGQLWTHSAYFKLIDAPALPNQFLLSIYEFNSTGVYQTEGTVNIRNSITGSLQRFSLARTLASAGTTRVQPLVQFYLTIGATYDFTYRVAAPQMETGDVATDWIATTTTAVSVGPVSNLPRLNYPINADGSVGCPSLLLEPQRTNSLLFSEQFNNAPWSLDGDGVGQSLTANYAISPDGYQNADRLQLNKTGGTFSRIRQTAVGANTYTFSVYMKSNTGVSQNVGLRLDTTGTNNLVTTSWQRFTLTAAVGTPQAQIILFDSIVGNDEIADILIWGAQLEVGAYATSYIPTLSTSVTRVADACSKTGISSLIGQTEGTLFADVNLELISDTAGILGITGSGTTFVYLFKTSGNDIVANVFIAGAVQAAMSYTMPSAGRYKVAVAYKQNDFVLYVNGVQRASDNSGSVPTCTDLYINSSAFAVSPNSNHNQALVFKTRLTNAQMQELTSL
jgi:hypothetical protein